MGTVAAGAEIGSLAGPLGTVAGALIGLGLLYLTVKAVNHADNEADKQLSPAPAKPCQQCGESASGDPNQQEPDKPKRKPDPNASKPYRDNPGQLEGRAPEDVEKELDQKLVDEGGWTKSPSRDGNGTRYIDGKGGSVIINKGYPEGLEGGGGDAVHQGPYVKIQPGGARVPLAGNPAAGP